MSARTPGMADILGWDVRNWSRAVDCWNGVLPSDLSGKTALETGAGEGGLSLYLAARGCHVVCSDYGSSAERAQASHASFGVEQMVAYTRADAAHLPYPDGSFDFTAFKSVLGGIGRHRGLDGQRQAVAELHRVLKPGGMILFADNLRATRLHRFIRRRFVPWGHDWRYPTLAEFRALFAPFSRVEIGSFGVVAALGRSERQRSALHYIDLVINPIFPAGCRYVGYGYAVK